MTATVLKAGFYSATSTVKDKAANVTTKAAVLLDKGVQFHVRSFIALDMKLKQFIDSRTKKLSGNTGHE